MFQVEPLFDTFGARVSPGDERDLREIDLSGLRDQLEHHGALLFRGFVYEPGIFEAFTRRLPLRFLAHGATVRQAVGPDPSTQRVTGGNAPFVLHRELHFCPFSPDVLWFHCAIAPERGGESILGDGAALYRALSPRTRDFFHQYKVRYWNRWATETWRRYFGDVPQEVVLARLAELDMQGEFEPDGQLVFTYATYAVDRAPNGQPVFANAIDIHYQYLANLGDFQVNGDPTLRHDIALEDGSPIPEDIKAEVHELSAAHERELRWQPGDVVMIDNKRVMHGRRGFDAEASRQVYVRMSFWE